MALSCWGRPLRDPEPVFEPVLITPPRERADILEQSARTVIALHRAGLITRREALAELRDRGRDLSAFTRLGLPEEDPRRKVLEETGASPYNDA